MTVRECMKSKVISIRAGATVRDAVELLVRHKIGTLPVVDSQNKLVGLIKLRDVVSLVMPDFVRLLDNFEFVHNFGAVETRKPSRQDLARRVEEIMQPAVHAEETNSLLHAAATLHREGLKDLPVVDAHGYLVGIASHVDISTALMRQWDLDAPQSNEAGTPRRDG